MLILLTDLKKKDIQNLIAYSTFLHFERVLCLMSHQQLRSYMEMGPRLKSLIRQTGGAGELKLRPLGTK